jgi:hypothetical protein
LAKEIHTWRSLSGDSAVRDIAFTGGVVTFILEDCDSDLDVRVTIATDAAVIRGGSSIEPVFAQLVDVAEYLPVHADSGIFIAPSDFGRLMQAARAGATLAIGRQSAEWPFIFLLRGYDNWLMCLVDSESSISVEVIE